MFWVIVSGGDKGQFFVARGQYKALLLVTWWHWPRKGGTGWYLVVLSQFRAALVCTYTRVLSWEKSQGANENSRTKSLFLYYKDFSWHLCLVLVVHLKCWSGRQSSRCNWGSDHEGQPASPQWDIPKGSASRASPHCWATSACARGCPRRRSPPREPWKLI